MKPLVIKIGDIDAILLFGKYNGYKLSELFEFWEGRNYMIYLIKHMEEEDVKSIIVHFYSTMIAPLSIHDMFDAESNFMKDNRY